TFRPPARAVLPLLLVDPDGPACNRAAVQAAVDAAKSGANQVPCYGHRMAPRLPPFVDLHLHAEGVSDADLTTLSWFGLRAAVTCAHDAGASSAEELRRHWDELVNVQARRLQRAGIRPWVALAVHPARIP